MRGSGRSATSTGRSSTSKTRSNETSALASCTRAFDRPEIGPYIWPRYAPNATIAPIVKSPWSTSWPPSQNTSAVPIAEASASAMPSPWPITPWRTATSRTASARAR